MKRRSFIAIALMLVLVMAIAIIGCSKSTAQGNTSGSTKQNADASGQQPGRQSGQPTAQQSSQQAAGKKDISVIAKSGSQEKTGDEKEAVLNDIEKELNEIIDNVNALEDVQDSDLQ